MYVCSSAQRREGDERRRENRSCDAKSIPSRFDLLGSTLSLDVTDSGFSATTH